MMCDPPVHDVAIHRCTMSRSTQALLSGESRESGRRGNLFE